MFWDGEGCVRYDAHGDVTRRKALPKYGDWVRHIGLIHQKRCNSAKTDGCFGKCG